MASSLAEFLARCTAEQAYPATAFRSVSCSCGSDHFRLARVGPLTKRTCSRCGTVCSITGACDEENEAGREEKSFFCAECGADKASVGVGFAGNPESMGVDAVLWFYVGVRCCVCGRDECFNDGKLGRGPMGESVFREVTGETPRRGSSA